MPPISVANFLMVLLQYSAFHQIYSWVPRLDKASHWQPPSSLSERGYYSSLSRESSGEDAFLKTPMDMDEVRRQAVAQLGPLWRSTFKLVEGGGR